MLTHEEKLYLLKLLARDRRKLFYRKTPELNLRLTEKLEQMIRNERINQ